MKNFMELPFFHPFLSCIVPSLVLSFCVLFCWIFCFSDRWEVIPQIPTRGRGRTNLEVMIME